MALAIRIRVKRLNTCSIKSKIRHGNNPLKGLLCRVHSGAWTVELVRPGSLSFLQCIRCSDLNSETAAGWDPDWFLPSLSRCQPRNHTHCPINDGVSDILCATPACLICFFAALSMNLVSNLLQADSCLMNAGCCEPRNICFFWVLELQNPSFWWDTQAIYQDTNDGIMVRLSMRTAFVQILPISGNWSEARWAVAW